MWEDRAQERSVDGVMRHQRQERQQTGWLAVVNAVSSDLRLISDQMLLAP